MKRIAFAAFLAITASACSPGQVQITNHAPGKVEAPGSSGQGSRNEGNPSSGAPPSNQIYFEHALTQGSQIDQIVGVAFVSGAATSTTADNIALDTPMNFAPTSILAGGPDGVTFLQSDGLMANSLVSVTLGTLTATSLYTFPQGAAAVSISLATKQVASIDDLGGVAVTDLISGKAQGVSLPSGETAVTLKLAESGTQLLVLTASGNLLTFDLNGTWSAALSVPSIVTAAWSADGAHLAYLDTKANLTVDGAATATLNSADVHDLSWDGEVLLYWARLSSGVSEIRTLDPSSPTEKTLTTINVSPSTADGVVCPAHAGSVLYYTEFTHGEYQVEKSTSAGPVAVAIPPTDVDEPDEGFLCPVVAPTQGGLNP